MSQFSILKVLTISYEKKLLSTSPIIVEKHKQLLFWQLQIKILPRANTSYGHNWNFLPHIQISVSYSMSLHTLIWQWFQGGWELSTKPFERGSAEYSNFYIFWKDCLGLTLINHPLISPWGMGERVIKVIPASTSKHYPIRILKPVRCGGETIYYIMKPNKFIELLIIYICTAYFLWGKNCYQVWERSVWEKSINKYKFFLDMQKCTQKAEYYSSVALERRSWRQRNSSWSWIFEININSLLVNRRKIM